MTVWGRPGNRSGLGIPIAMGIWAGAVALAPTLQSRLIFAAPVLFVPLVWWTMLKPQLWLMLFFISALLLPPLPISVAGRGLHPSMIWAIFGVLVGVLRFSRWRQLPSSLTAAFAVFTVSLLVSIGLGALYSGPDIAAASFARVLLFAVGPYILFYTLAETKHSGLADTFRSVRLLFAVSVAAALFACVDFYFQFPAPTGYGPQFVWLSEGVFRRAQGFFYEASTLGNLCAFFILMIAVALFRPRAERPCSLVWLLGGGAILGTALIFSYSRASLLNLGIAIGALTCLQGARLRRKLLGLLIGVPVTAAIVYLIFPSFAESYWLRLAASVQYLWSSPEGVLSGRVASWKILTAFLAREPWNAIFGIGYKTIPYSDYLGGAVIGDNTYLTLLVEAGIVGLSSFLYLNFEILRNSLRAARSTQPTAQFCGTWIFCFWIGEMVQMLSGDLITYWRVLPIFFWTLAIAVRESRATTASINAIVEDGKSSAVQSGRGLILPIGNVHLRVE